MAATPNIIPSDSTSVFDVLQKLSTTQQQVALIRPNNPPPGIAGFLFDIVGDEVTEMTTDITDHFLEDNTSIQDQAALRPEKVTVRGFVAELILTQAAASKVAPTSNPLPNNAALSPAVTPAAAQAKAAQTTQTTQTQGAIANGQSLYGVYQNLASQNPNQTRQQQVFGYFYQLWKGRQFFSVETPWGVFNSMMIESCRSEQSEDTKYRTDMTITFKKVRFATPSATTLGQIAGRASFQRAPVTNSGTASTQPLTPAQTESFLHQITAPMIKKLITP